MFKASKSLTFDGSTSEVLKMIYGMSDDPEISVEEMLHGGKELPDGTLMEDPHTWFRRELSGKSLEVLTDRSIEEIQARLDDEFNRLPSDGTTEEVGFLIWARNMLSDGEAYLARRRSEPFADWS